MRNLSKLSTLSKSSTGFRNTPERKTLRSQDSFTNRIILALFDVLALKSRGNRVNRERLTSQFRNAFASALGRAIALALLLPILQGCTNNLSSAYNSTRKVVGGGGSSDDENSGALSGFRIVSVLRSSVDPASSMDIVGDGSGEIGRLCGTTDTNSSGGSSGSTPCVCSFEYVAANGATQSFTTPALYSEDNLVRCNYNATLLDSVTSVKVKLYLTGPGQYSNELTFRMSSGSTKLNTGEEASFVTVKRYQCQDSIYIPHLLDSSVYDPFRSTDTDLTYPLNFYTTNLGGALGWYVSNSAAAPSGGAGWDCPSNPTAASATTNLNMRIYSQAKDSSGSMVIFPPTPGSFDRSTFYLARSATGPFSVAVNALVAPNTVSAEGSDTNPAPLGYGAAPIPLASGGETCPELTTTIPEGYQWVKVWLFRVSLEERYFKSSTKLQSSVGAISCNPGEWADGSSPVYSACTSNFTGQAGVGGGGNIADRLLSNGQCYRLSGVGGGNGAGRASAASYPTGTDIWDFYGASCGSGTPLNLCAAGGNEAAPYESQLIDTSLDNGLSRSDYVFVVTPTSVMVSDMKNETTRAQPYIPFRYKTSNYCLSPDPSNPTSPDDCSLKGKLTYGIKLTDISVNADEPGPGRLPVYPVCALQPKP